MESLTQYCHFYIHIIALSKCPISAEEDIPLGLRLLAQVVCRRREGETSAPREPGVGLAVSPPPSGAASPSAAARGDRFTVLGVGSGGGSHGQRLTDPQTGPRTPTGPWQGPGFAWEDTCTQWLLAPANPQAPPPYACI